MRLRSRSMRPAASIPNTWPSFSNPMRILPCRNSAPRSSAILWETTDAYLSGPVRTKLAAAEAAAALDRQYERNVAALREVQPRDVRPSDITARLGAPWLPTDVIEAFTAKIMGKQ